MITCEVEEFIPIPTGASKPYKDVRAKAEAACNAAKLLEAEGFSGNGSTLKQSKDAAKSILTSLAKGQEPLPGVVNSALSTPGGAYFVRSILQEYDMQVVHEAKTLRHYVTNKLIVESDNMDARIRMKALELLGKISDVGLFSERTEVTVTNKSTSELEEVLKSKLKKLMGDSEVQDAVILPVVELPRKPIDLSSPGNRI
jgi:hypothetical protein